MALEKEFVGRTYDDFLFRPQAGAVPSRSEIHLGARLARRLSLELPVVSANRYDLYRHAKRSLCCPCLVCGGWR